MGVRGGGEASREGEAGEAGEAGRDQIVQGL